MKKIDRADLLPLGSYEEVRDPFRRRIIQLKEHRRVSVGDRVSIVFENRDTMLFQIQEMLRAERITTEAAIRQELGVYNEILPGPRELAATLFVEIPSTERIREDLHGLVGIDEHVALTMGSERVAALFEAGRSTEDKLSSVQYLKFGFGEAARKALGDPAVAAKVVIDHPRFRHETTLSSETRASLLEDFDDWD